MSKTLTDARKQELLASLRATAEEHIKGAYDELPEDEANDEEYQWLKANTSIAVAITEKK